MFWMSVYREGDVAFIKLFAIGFRVVFNGSINPHCASDNSQMLRQQLLTGSANCIREPWHDLQVEFTANEL